MHGVRHRWNAAFYHFRLARKPSILRWGLTFYIRWLQGAGYAASDMGLGRDPE